MTEFATINASEYVKKIVEKRTQIDNEKKAKYNAFLNSIQNLILNFIKAMKEDAGALIEIHDTLKAQGFNCNGAHEAITIKPDFASDHMKIGFDHYRNEYGIYVWDKQFMRGVSFCRGNRDFEFCDHDGSPIGNALDWIEKNKEDEKRVKMFARLIVELMQNFEKFRDAYIAFVNTQV